MSWFGTVKDSIKGLGQHTDHTDSTMDSETNLHDIELDHGASPNRAVSIGDVGAPARFRHIKNNKYMRRLYLVLAALAAIFVFSSLLRLAIKSNKNKGGDGNAVSHPDFDLSGSSVRESHLLILMSENSEDNLDKTSLKNVTSPQRKALYWIANDDPMQLEIPETRFDLSYTVFLQRYSVAVLTFALGKEALTPLGFLTGTNECDWHADYKRPDGSILQQGIICNGEQEKVQKIVLQTLGLTGSLPREIGHLHSVKHMHLDSNMINGKLPQTMHHMQQLREFTATRNSFSGHLPTFLGKMADLRHIELSKNKFSGHLGAFAVSETTGDEATDDIVSPLRVLAVDNNHLSGPMTYLKGLYVLEELYLDNNVLTGHVGDTFTTLSQLAIFTAAENKLSGKVPDYLLELPSMTILDLHTNEISGAFPHGNATGLKYLDLHANSIEGALPKSIGSKPELVFLDVSQNAITGDLPTEIGDLINMQYLFLSDNTGLTPAEIPEFIWQLPVLESLAMRSTQRTGVLPEWLSELDGLSLLDLERNDLNGTLPETMSNMSSLEFLFLNRNRFSGEIPDSFGNLTNMVLLNIDHNDLTGVVPDQVCKMGVEAIVADCGVSDAQPEPTIDCPCCTKCCLPDASNCNTRDWSKRYGEEWGGNFYERYNIVEDGDVFEIIGDDNGNN